MTTAPSPRPWIAPILALLAWTAAATHAVRTVRGALSARSRNVARDLAHTALQPELDRMASHTGLRARLIEATADQPPFDFAQWLEKAHPTVPRPTLRARTEAAGAAWAWQTTDAEWPAVSLEAFGEIVSTAESLIPPVRLVAATLDPLPEAGLARVTATFATATGNRNP